MNGTINESDQDQAQVLDHILAIGEAIKKHITKNPRKVYQLIVEITCQVTGADCAVIYPYHPSYGEFYDAENVAACGLRHELPVEKRADKRRRLSARIHREGEVVREDIEREEPQMPQESSFVAREGVKALMGLSLRVGDNILGILYVDYRRPHHFSAAEKKMIRLLGQQAAIAISNSWTFRLADIRANTVAKLKTVGQSLVAIGDPSETLDSVLDGIAHSAQEVLDADIVDLYQYVQSLDEFVLPPVLAGERSYPHLIPSRIYDDDIVVKAVKMGEPQYIHDAQAAPLLTGKFEIPRDGAPDQRFVIREEVASSAMIPLTTVGETVGVMFVNYRTPQLFGPEQKDVIESFAAQAAIAIHNAKLYSSERRRNRDLEVLNESAIKLGKILDAGQVYQAVLEAVIDTLRCNYCTIFLVEPGNVLVSHIFGGKLFAEPPKLHFTPGEGLAGWVYQHNQSLIISNTATDSRYKPGPLEKDIKPRSIILSPLRRGEKVIGVVSADIDRPDAFNENDLRLLDTLTLQASTVLQNIEFFNDFRILHDVASNLAQQPTQEQIYQTAVQAVCETLRCRHSTVFTLDENAGQLVAVARAGAPQPASEVRHFKLGEGLAGTVAETGQSMRVNDAARDERFLEGKVKPRSAPRSVVLAPIKIEDQVIGVISADKDETDGFTRHNLRVLEMLALDVGGAINVHRRLQQVSDQAQALTELNELAQQLISLEESPQDTRNLLEQVARSARQVLRADIIELYEYVQEQNDYRLPPVSIGERRGPAVVKDEIYPDDAVFQLIHREKPLYVESVQRDSILSGPYTIERKDQPAERFVVREEIQSTAAIPLRAGSETVGLMFANYRTPQTFGVEQRELIELFANQAATAIHNSRLFGESLRQRNELQVVDEVGKLLMATLDSREIPRLLLQRVVRLFGVEGASLWQVDQARRSVECLFSLDRRGEEEFFTDILRSMTFRFGDGIVGTVAETGEPMIANRVREEPRWDRRVDEATGFETRSILAVPLVHQQETIGVVEVLNRLDETPFTAEDRDFLASIVSPAAIALENARHVQILSALNEVGQTLTSGIRLQEDEILNLIYEQARKLTGTQNIYIALYEEQTDTITFRLVMERGQGVDVEQQEGFAPRKINKAQRGKTEEVILTKKPILHKTRAEARAWYDQPGHREYIGAVSASHLAVPMVIGEKVTGVIAIYDWEREGAYDEQDLQVLSAMASQAAIALDNARLYYEVNQALERRVRALTALNEVGQTLTYGIRLQEDEILELIYEQARKLTGTHDMYIALYDEAANRIRFGIALEKGQRVAIESRRADMERRGKTEEVIYTRQPILHRTKQESEGWYRLPGHQEFIGRVQASYLGVPMLVGEKSLGMIAIYDWEREYAYDEQDLQVLSSMASQAAIALDNARLLRERAVISEELIAARQLAALGTATAAIQHRINNTLNIIGPNITRLRRRVDTSDATIQEILGIIERNTQYTSDYVTRIQEPLKETEIQAVDINASLREAQAQVWGQYLGRPEFGIVEIVYNLDDALPLIEASLGQITEIFRNLIENSYKAMGAEGGDLTVVSRGADGWIEVEIRDTGPGIPPNIRDRLFTKPVPSGDPGAGSGLGLWLTNLLLQKYAGEIIIADTGPDGTTMLVRLPASRSPKQV